MIDGISITNIVWVSPFLSFANTWYSQLSLIQKLNILALGLYIYNFSIMIDDYTIIM